MPASRSARATTFAPRSCPSSPGLAMTTRILPLISGSVSGSACTRPNAAARRGREPRSELFEGGVGEEEGLLAAGAEVDLHLGLLGDAVDGDDGAEAEGVVGDPVAGRER